MPTKYIVMSRKKYREMTGETRQNVSNKVKRGTLKTVPVMVKKEEDMLALTEKQWAKIQAKRQLGKVDTVHDEA